MKMLYITCFMLVFGFLTAGCDDSTDDEVTLDPLTNPQNIVLEYEDPAGDFTELRLNMSWDPVAGAVSYKVRLYFDDAFALTSDLDLPPDDNEVDIDVTEPSAVYEFLAPGTRFAYRVGAVREDGVIFAENGVYLDTAPILRDFALSICILDTLAAMSLNWEDTEGPNYSDIINLYCDEGVKSLEGIEILNNVEKLLLPFNEIEDLSPLTSLPHLRQLALSYNLITDLSPLSQISSLEHLSISDNPGITTLAPLGSLTSLAFLQVGDSPALTSLEGLPATLQELSLVGEITTNGLYDMTNLLGLELIGLEDPNFDQEDLGALTSLESIFIDHYELLDTDFLAPLTALNKVVLFSNGLTDISTLITLENLVEVKLIGNDLIPCDQLDTLAAMLEPDSFWPPESCTQ